MPVETLKKIALYCFLIGVVASAFSSYSVREQVRDAASRRYLQVHGTYAVANVTKLRCPHLKSNIEVSFKDRNGTTQIECPNKIGDDLSIEAISIGQEFDIVYDPALPSRVYLAPNRNLPQRDVRGIWVRWAYQNFGDCILDKRRLSA